MANIQFTFGKRLALTLAMFVLTIFSLIMYKATIDRKRYDSENVHELPREENWTYERFRRQRNELSAILNHMMMLYGQQSCELLKLKQMNDLVSENGGWCADASRPNSRHHVWDEV
ncbi:uncharacterized protein LOC131926961 [Physella acuta]|uniref:uncharacterized protein LOC131926961 n=1 Tax=Physella acuta TaxID=109671 RepID=UPI0027DE04DA|nr:uncharacterized protein LOC131926961 [Physella acuta]